MEIHRQQCQNCGSYETRNIIVREADLPTTIYVRCGGCGELVARYKLSEYYHHGKGLESFVRSYGTISDESGREVMDAFKRIQKDSAEGYEQVLKALDKEGKEI